MMKKIYVLAWFLLAGSVLASVFTGTFNPLAMVVSSLIVVGLVYGFALWSVMVNPRETPSLAYVTKRRIKS